MIHFPFQSIAVTFDIDNSAVMQQSIKNSSNDYRIMEQLSPVAKGLVRSDNRTGLFIPVCNEPKEQIAFLTGDRGITELLQALWVSASMIPDLDVIHLVFCIFSSRT